MKESVDSDCERRHPSEMKWQFCWFEETIQKYYTWFGILQSTVQPAAIQHSRHLQSVYCAIKKAHHI